MSEVNKYGLARDIPDPIKRLVRQRCGFGCVVCGKGIYHYDHLEPEFADAREHNPDGIILLCGGCHDKKNKKFLSKITIENRAQNPLCKQQGFSFEAFDIGIEYPEIQIGTFFGKNIRCLIRVSGDEIFSILPPEAPHTPYKINSRMADRDGKIIFEIHENEWRIPTENWDVEQSGERIIVRKKLRDIILSIRVDAPNRLVVERLDMEWKGRRILVNGEDFIINDTKQFFSATNLISENFDVGINIR